MERGGQLNGQQQNGQQNTFGQQPADPVNSRRLRQQRADCSTAGGFGRTNTPQQYQPPESIQPGNNYPLENNQQHRFAKLQDSSIDSNRGWHVPAGICNPAETASRKHNNQMRLVTFLTINARQRIGAVAPDGRIVD